MSWLAHYRQNKFTSLSIGGEWEIDSDNKETQNSFGGFNFIAYYATGEQDRRKIYNNQVKSEILIIDNNLENFINKAI